MIWKCAWNSIRSNRSTGHLCIFCLKMWGKMSELNISLFRLWRNTWNNWFWKWKYWAHRRLSSTLISNDTIALTKLLRYFSVSFALNLSYSICFPLRSYHRFTRSLCGWMEGRILTCACVCFFCWSNVSNRINITYFERNSRFPSHYSGSIDRHSEPFWFMNVILLPLHYSVQFYADWKDQNAKRAKLTAPNSRMRAWFYCCDRNSARIGFLLCLLSIRCVCEITK